MRRRPGSPGFARHSLEGRDRRGRHFCGAGRSVVLAGSSDLVGWLLPVGGGRGDRRGWPLPAPRRSAHARPSGGHSDRYDHRPDGGHGRLRLQCRRAGLCALCAAWRRRDGEGLSGHHGTGIVLRPCQHRWRSSRAVSPVESHEAIQFLLSPDGRAASALLTAVMTSAGITVFSMIGGALGTRIFSGRDSFAGKSLIADGGETESSAARIHNNIRENRRDAA